MTLLVATGDDGRLPLGPGIVALALYTLLILLTVRRLRDAGMNLAWVALMIFTLRFGPSWRIMPGLRVMASDVLPLIPVAIGWCARSAARDEVAQPA